MEAKRKKLLQKYIKKRDWPRVRYALKIMMSPPSQRDAGEGGGSGGGSGGESGDQPPDRTSEPLTDFELGSEEEISALKDIANDVLDPN